MLDREDEGLADMDPGLVWASGGVHLATITRGNETDSVHFGMACLVDAEGKVLWSLGDPNTRACFRSSAKPIQALAVVESGAADAYGFDDADLAVMCGSHKGGPENIRQVRSLLSKCGLDEKHLGCGDGVADPCSGKHAGMLAACRHRGLPLEGYLDPAHPWQRSIREALCACCAIPESELTLVDDGCSAPTFGLPLYHMALGFARMGKESARPDSAGEPPARIFRAMVSEFIHTGEPDMRGFQAGGGVPVTKGGANGLHCAALPALGLGFAVKIADGSAMVRWPVFTGALERVGLIRPEHAALMRTILWPHIATRKGLPAGEIRLGF